jgi:arylsulfatase A-like enzyme
MTPLRSIFLALLFGCTQTSSPKTTADAPPAPTAPAVQQRSVVIISLDTVSASRLEVYGGRAKTPNLVAFAAQGVRFERAIANMTETALSHWAMMTGVLPEVHGNVPATGDSRCTSPTLAQRLSSVGYATAAFIGGETLTHASTGLGRGFDTYDDTYNWDRVDLKRPGDQVAAKASAWINDQTGPYFAFVHLFDAHFPYTPPPPFDTQYDPTYTGTITGSDADLRPYRDGERTPSAADLAHVLALYDGELSELDQLIQPVLTAAGPNTFVLVTADHGESFDHGYYFNHRDGLWDDILRVPLLIRGPGLAKNHVVKQQVELVDVTPTVLDLLGLSPLDTINGSSRAAAAKGAVLKEKPGHAITDPWRGTPRVAVVDSRRKAVASAEKIVKYDLVKDPGEFKPKTLSKGSIDMVWGGYNVRMSNTIRRWQGAELPAKVPPVDQQRRLEALGYAGEVNAAPDVPATGARSQ